MYLTYNFDGEQYEFDLTYKQIREAIAEIYCRDYCASADKDTVKDFIYRFDLEDNIFDVCEDDLHDYFRDEAYQRYCDETDEIKMNPEIYDLNYDIHGGV